MGWANCGEDDKGRPIGYAHPARCDRPGCKKKIHRGLAYVCGQMHGEDEHSCGGYFCYDHRVTVEFKDGAVMSICLDCEKLMQAENMLVVD